IIEFRVTYPQINHNFKIDISYIAFLISTKKAIHLGLIISEILLNSIKYAASNEKNYELQVNLKQTSDQSIELIIGDNGSGFDFDKANKKETLGLDLIKDLADSLNLKAKFPSKDNSYYTFNFKL
ncbi:MAG: ATP-binding protein, partial [Bacteroidia bacterium]